MNTTLLASETKCFTIRVLGRIEGVSIMLSFILMFLFSIWLIAYGLIALFKKDWIWKIRSFSAGLEGKGDLKRDEVHTEKINRMGNTMAIISLVLGIIGFVMNIATLIIFLNPQM
jgi:hypothetical protein